MGSLITSIGSWLIGGGISDLTDKLSRAYEQKLNAENSEQARAAEILIERLETQRAIATIEAQDRWSALRIGRLLIVVPFGIWWAAIFVVSTFNLQFAVLDIPPRIWDMAYLLIPAILLGEVAQSGVKWWRK